MFPEIFPLLRAYYPLVTEPSAEVLRLSTRMSEANSHGGARRQDQPELIRARRACAILRNLGEVARTYLCLDRERRVREGTCPAKGTGFSNLHSVGRIRMRPVTNRGLRRRRPPRTRATVTRMVSSPFPSLSTDTGGRYMSLSTRPALRAASPENALAVVVPSRIRHSADEDLVLDAERDDGKRSLRRPMDMSRSEVTNTAPRMHVRREKQWVVLGAVAYTKDRILLVDGIRGGRHEVIAVRFCVGDHVPSDRKSTR